jgi:DnaJ-class molecular chaperone
VVTDQVRRRAADLSDVEALELFNLTPSASREQLQHAWRLVSQRWHPDKAADEAQRAEHHVAFVAYQTAYERLCEAYDSGRLPRNVTATAD